MYWPASALHAVVFCNKSRAVQSIHCTAPRFCGLMWLRRSLPQWMQFGVLARPPCGPRSGPPAAKDHVFLIPMWLSALYRASGGKRSCFFDSYVVVRLVPGLDFDCGQRVPTVFFKVLASMIGQKSHGKPANCSSTHLAPTVFHVVNLLIFA